MMIRETKTMKNYILKLGMGVLFLFPLYGYAEEVPSFFAVNSTKITNATATITDNEESVASTTPVKTFTLCSQEAIESRDTRITTSRVTYNTAMVDALTERKEREKAAIAITDDSEKKDAIKISVEVYKNQAKTAQATLVAARKLAWQTFESDIKQCHEANQEGDVTTISKTKTDVALPEEPAPTMRKMEKGIEKVEEKETRTIKETIKAQFESFKSLFQ